MSKDVKSSIEKQVRAGTYNSVMLKVGILYKYKQTIIFILLFEIGVAIPWLLGDVPASAIVTDFIWLQRPLVVIYLTYLLSNTINEFVQMFNLFGERADEATWGAMRMFPTEEERDKFRHKAYKVVFSRWEWLFGIIGAFGMTAGMFLLYAKPPYYMMEYRVGEVVIYNDATKVSFLISNILNAIFGFFAGVAVWILFGIIGSVIFLGRSGVLPESAKRKGSLVRRPLTQQDRLDNLSDTMRFFEFHRSVRSVGDFMYRLCVKIIIVGFIWVVLLVAIDIYKVGLGWVGFGALILSIVVMLAVFVMFVAPQFTIHRLIVAFKESVLLNLNLVYEDIQGTFLRSMFDQEFLKEGKKWRDRAEVRDDADIIEKMINHTKSMGAWSFSFPTALKLLAAATVPLFTAIGQAVLPLLLGAL